MLALGCAELASRCPLRSVPGMASESSVELGLTARSDALRHHLGSFDFNNMHIPCALTACCLHLFVSTPCIAKANSKVHCGAEACIKNLLLGTLTAYALLAVLLI